MLRGGAEHQVQRVLDRAAANPSHHKFHCQRHIINSIVNGFAAAFQTRVAGFFRVFDADNSGSISLPELQEGTNSQKSVTPCKRALIHKSQLKDSAFI
jgi:hypothetical protein